MYHYYGYKTRTLYSYESKNTCNISYLILIHLIKINNVWIKIKILISFFTILYFMPLSVQQTNKLS